MKEFRDKVAAITGAGSGIGRALALDLVGRGCALALADINEKGLADTVGQLASSGVKVTSQSLDVADRAAVHAWADQVVADHGRVNLIFNNAGVALGSTVEHTRYEDLEWLLNINLWGVIHGTKAFLPHLTAAGEGHVINISSIFGLIGVPSQSAYNAAKFAVRGFTESLREELEIEESPVSATCVHPGGIKTNISRSARLDDSVRELVPGAGADPREWFEHLFITSPEKAAATILAGVRRNARRVLIGPDARAVDLIQRLLPTAYQRLIVAGSRRLRKRPAPSEPRQKQD